MYAPEYWLEEADIEAGDGTSTMSPGGEKLDRYGEYPRELATGISTIYSALRKN